MFRNSMEIIAISMLAGYVSKCPGNVWKLGKMFGRVMKCAKKNVWKWKWVRHYFVEWPVSRLKLYILFFFFYNDYILSRSFISTRYTIKLTKMYRSVKDSCKNILGSFSGRHFDFMINFVEFVKTILKDQFTIVYYSVKIR